MAATATATSSAAATAFFIHRLPATKTPSLLPHPTFHSSTTFNLRKGTPLLFTAIDSRSSSSQVVVKASDESSLDTNELLTDLKEKWDAVEDKPTVILYGGAAIVAVWLSSIVVGAVNSVPLLPKIMELVGLGYTGWFVYRYLLFKSSRKELATDIEAIKKKIAGTD